MYQEDYAYEAVLYLRRSEKWFRYHRPDLYVQIAKL